MAKIVDKTPENTEPYNVEVLYTTTLKPDSQRRWLNPGFDGLNPCHHSSGGTCVWNNIYRSGFADEYDTEIHSFQGKCPLGNGPERRR